MSRNSVIQLSKIKYKLTSRECGIGFSYCLEIFFRRGFLVIRAEIRVVLHAQPSVRILNLQ